jgi:hypothetical protein
VITISTSQIQHPFREILSLAEKVVANKDKNVTSLTFGRKTP